MIDLSRRLQNAMRDGNLTVADLSRWLGRPYPTVRLWSRGTVTTGAAGDEALVIERLKLIEKRIRRKAGLPVPQFTYGGRVRTQALRIAYLNKLMARKKL